jgi:hypothetical protein
MSRIKCPHCHLPIWAGAVACKGCGLHFRAAPPPVAPPVFYPPAHYQTQPLPAVYYPQLPTYPAYAPSDLPASAPATSPLPYRHRAPLNVQVIPKTKALLDSPMSGDEDKPMRTIIYLFIAGLAAAKVILFLCSY